MKVSIVLNMVPFVWGGAEELANRFHTELRLIGIDSELIRIPFYWEPYHRLEAEIQLCRALEIANADLVVGMKFPAYHITAKNKKIWLMHQFRQAYDLREAGMSNITETDDGQRVREYIIREDNSTFSSATELFTISQVVSDRLKRFNGFESSVLRAPLNDAHLLTGGDYSGYFLAAGRVNSSKRQKLIVEAMTHLPADVQLIIAGPPDSNADANEIQDFVRDNNLQDRVRLELRFLAREELAQFVNNASAILYLPFMEDSYGYVTMEAFEAGKAVITTKDSGELTEIVVDGVSGYVCEPHAEAIADAMIKLHKNYKLCRELGLGGRSIWRSKNINWRSHIERLLA